MSSASMKVDPKRLPAPPLEPTRPVRIDFPDSHSINPGTVVKTFEEQHKHRQQMNWSDAKDAVIIEMVHNGETQKAIADQLGCSKSAVTKRVQRLRRKGVDI